MKTSSETVPTTEDLWRERVAAWRASGQTARAFAQDRGFATGTLQSWASRLQRRDAPQFVRLVSKSTAPAPSAPDLVVEVGGARIRVAPGFDAALLGQVVRALGGAAR